MRTATQIQTLTQTRLITPILYKVVVAPVMTQEWLNTIWQKIIKVLHLAPGAKLNVIVIGNKRMLQLNKRYRGVNSVTDVLSFNYGNNFGEIVICYAQAKQQALAKQITLKQECAWLVIHGILHWYGYDHESAKDAKIMRPLEQQILALCSV